METSRIRACEHFCITPQCTYILEYHHLDAVPSYTIVPERFTSISRSDGKPQMLVPVPHCRYCWTPLREAYKDWGRCYNCNEQPQPRDGLPDRLFAATLYIPRVRGYEHNQEVIDLKNHGTHSKIYAEILVNVLEREGYGLTGGTIVPIPQTEVRAGTTGPFALAESLSELVGLPVCRCLRFIRPMRSQKTLKKKIDRDQNMQDSMTADPWGDAGTIILVDDIMTTTSTMREGTRALKVAGAQEVIGLIAARDAGIKSLEFAGVVKLA